MRVKNVFCKPVNHKAISKHCEIDPNDVNMLFLRNVRRDQRYPIFLPFKSKLVTFSNVYLTMVTYQHYWCCCDRTVITGMLKTITGHLKYHLVPRLIAIIMFIVGT